MTRYAVFVDAGYLFAQGAIALSGSKKPRSLCKLDEATITELLISFGQEKSGGCQLLRVYWYDGALNFAGPTAEQTTLAHLDNVKLRLGFVNSQGQQKGVDSLIVTDLIDLARNRAICDAVLVSGDEDVRIGVLLAQSFGVRVHLLGIEPSRYSQSRPLIQEADTTAEWDRKTVAQFLTVITPTPAGSSALVTSVEPTSLSKAVVPLEEDNIIYDPRLGSVVDDIVGSLDDVEISRLSEIFMAQRTVPPDFDRRLLVVSRSLMGRDLTTHERRETRKRFIAAIRLKA